MFECLKKDYSKPSKDYGSHGQGEVFIPKWGYIIPHTHKAQGAETPDNKMSEYAYGEIVALNVSGKIPWHSRDKGGVFGAAEVLVSEKVNCTFEDHKNAFNSTVGGAEILCIKGDSLSIHYAELILDAFSVTFPDRKIRGVKQKKSGDRGYSNLVAAKKAGADVALLGELFFIDNEKDYIDPLIYSEFLLSVLK